MRRALLDSGDIRESVTLANGSKRSLKMVSKLFNDNSRIRNYGHIMGRALLDLGDVRESVTLTKILNQIIIKHPK